MAVAHQRVSIGEKVLLVDQTGKVCGRGILQQIVNARRHYIVLDLTRNEVRAICRNAFRKIACGRKPNCQKQ